MLPGLMGIPTLRSSLYVPGTAQTIWSSSAITNVISNGYKHYGLRQVVTGIVIPLMVDVPSLQPVRPLLRSVRGSLLPVGPEQEPAPPPPTIPAFAPRQFRFTFIGSMQVDHVSFEIRDPASSYNTVFSPVEIKFGGASGIPGTVASPGTVVSDWIELFHSMTSSDALCVIMDINASYSGNKNFLYGGVTGPVMYYKDATPSYNIAAPAGAWNNQHDYVGLLTKIEAR